MAELVKAQCEQLCWEFNYLLCGVAMGTSIENTSPTKTTNNLVSFVGARYGWTSTKHATPEAPSQSINVLLFNTNKLLEIATIGSKHTRRRKLRWTTHQALHFDWGILVSDLVQSW